MARLYCSVMTNLYASVSTAKPAPLVFYCITPKLKKFCARPFIQGAGYSSYLFSQPSFVI